MIWIIIIAIVIIVGIFLYKAFDRDFITATHKTKDIYHLEFENGMEPDCKLMEKYTLNDKTFYVFIPLESLKAIPVEDIIILKCISDSPEKKTCVFPDSDDSGKIVEAFYNKYKDKYNFVID